MRKTLRKLLSQSKNGKGAERPAVKRAELVLPLRGKSKPAPSVDSGTDVDRAVVVRPETCESLPLYETLPDGGFFRYLVLEPGSEGEELVCRLEIAKLGDETTPEYDAISYVWGSRIRDQQVRCNGGIIFITQNLHDALVQVRHPSEQRILWADSICINQDDVSERGHQVGCMAEIYSNARRVLICLQSPDEAKVHGADAKSLVTYVEEMVFDGLERCDYQPGQMPYPRRGDPIFTDERWKSYRVLTRQPWFRRGWVVQEAGLAREAIIIWGRHELSFPSVVRAYHWVVMCAPPIVKRYNLGLSDLHVETFESMHEREIRPLYNQGYWTRPTFLSILGEAMGLNLDDPRDRVYAFLHLANKLAKTDLVVEADYTKHYLDVYLDLAIQYVRETGSLNLLSRVDHDSSTLQQSIPSWVPRWDTSINKTTIPDQHMTSRQNCTDKPVLRSEDNSLAVWGVIIDTVRTCTQTLRHNMPLDNDELASLWVRLVRERHSSAYDPKHMPLAFTWTLACGLFEGFLSHWFTHRAAYIHRILQAAPVPEADAAGYEAEGHEGNVSAFHSHVQDCTHNRRFATTRRGYYGLVPKLAKKGDLIAIIFGADTPFILRETGVKDEYKLIGSCYITGSKVTDFADHEAMCMLGADDSKDWVNWDVDEVDFYLV